MPILGKIVASDSLVPVRNTHVISKLAHCGTISNLDGVFLVPAKPVDTLWVSCLGYSRRLIAVDSTMVNDTMLIVLWRDLQADDHRYAFEAFAEGDPTA